MATIKLKDGKVILKDGKVSCECCNEGFILDCDRTNPAWEEYGSSSGCHTSPSWCVVKKPDGSTIYDGCPSLNFVKIGLIVGSTIQVRYSNSKCGGGHQCNSATFKLSAMRGTAKSYIGDVNLNNGGTGANVDGGTFTVTQEILDGLDLP
jgi:hypothetical protein